MKITYYGHSCFKVVINEKELLFDPFITPNEKASNINIEDITADYILISHGHQDHVADVVEIAKSTGAKLISSFEVIEWFDKKGLDGHPMNHGGKWEFDLFTARYVNAIHSSSMPDGSYGGNPGGFLITSSNGNLYYAGDTALTMDMQLIPRYCRGLDLAVLPIGDNFTMGIEDAIACADMIKCDRILGCHYDTFGYIEIDHDKARDTFKKAGKELILAKPGETVDIG